MLYPRSLLPGVLLMLAACTTMPRSDTPPLEEDPRLGNEVRNLCFAQSIDSFGETTHTTVVVREGFDYYLIETMGRCFDLSHAQSISLDSATSCLSRGDKIRAYDSVFGPDNIGPSSVPCTVKAIYEWDPDATAEEPGDNTDNTEDNSENAPQ